MSTITVYPVLLSRLLTLKYGTSFSFSNRVKIISESFNANDNNIILNMSGEGLLSINLAMSIIKYKNLKPEKTKLIFNVDIEEKLHKEFFREFEIEIYYAGLCNMVNYHTVLQRQNIDWKSIEIDKHIVALASRPTITRAMYIKSLLDLFPEQSIVSFGLRSYVEPNIKRYLYPYVAPITIDHNYTTDTTLVASIVRDTPTDRIYKSLINLVLETNAPENKEIFITEKSFKSFAWHQLPVIVAGIGHVERLRKLGFDMFDDIFDGHKYNEEHTYNYHIKVISLLNKFIKKYPNIQDIQNLRYELFDRLEYNSKLLNKYVENDPYDWSCLEN